MDVTWRNLERPINRDRRSKAGDDVAARRASDRTIKSQSSIFTLRHVVHSDSLANPFYNDLISAVDQRSYNEKFI